MQMILFANKIIMLKPLIPLLILLTTTLPVQAEWIKADAASKPGETHYFDLKAMQKDSEYRKIWMLSSYAELQPGGYRSVKTLYQFDCSSEKIRVTTLLLYPDKTAATAPIGARHDENRDWFGYSPQSVFGEIAQTICTD